MNKLRYCILTLICFLLTAYGIGITILYWETAEIADTALSTAMECLAVDLAKPDPWL